MSQFQKRTLFSGLVAFCVLIVGGTTVCYISNAMYLKWSLPEQYRLRDEADEAKAKKEEERRKKQDEEWESKRQARLKEKEANKKDLTEKK